MASLPGLVGRGRERTENAPSAMHWSPPARPITAAGTPAAAAAPSTAATWSAATATTTRDADSPKAASAAGARPGAGRVEQVDPEPGPAAERHLAQRDREPAVAHVVHTGDLARPAPASATSACSRDAGVEIGDGRRAAVEAVHDRRPFRAAELGARSRRARRSTRRRRAAAPAARRRARRSGRAPRRPASGGCRRRSTRCRRRRCRRSPGCRAPRTPRSCPRRLR